MSRRAGSGRCYPRPRSGGRVVEGGGLENRRGASSREFESHPLRQEAAPSTSRMAAVRRVNSCRSRPRIATMEPRDVTASGTLMPVPGRSRAPAAGSVGRCGAPGRRGPRRRVPGHPASDRRRVPAGSRRAGRRHRDPGRSASTGVASVGPTRHRRRPRRAVIERRSTGGDIARQQLRSVARYPSPMASVDISLHSSSQRPSSTSRSGWSPPPRPPPSMPDRRDMIGRRGSPALVWTSMHHHAEGVHVCADSRGPNFGCRMSMRRRVRSPGARRPSCRTLRFCQDRRAGVPVVPRSGCTLGARVV